MFLAGAFGVGTKVFICELCLTVVLSEYLGNGVKKAPKPCQAVGDDSGIRCFL